MKEEGELKKRIAKEYDCEMGLPEILAIIDEAEKEFPTLSAWNDPLIAYKIFYNQVQEWFVKYFGDELSILAL